MAYCCKKMQKQGFNPPKSSPNSGSIETNQADTSFGNLSKPIEANYNG